jgi:hypothetical protein
MLVNILLTAGSKNRAAATIPRQVIEALQITPVNILQWKVAEQKGEVYAKVKKVKD